jgi:CP family cyanate transporter-like MFS transporter
VAAIRRALSGWFGPGFALFLATLALRPQIVSIGPLAADIARDLNVSHAFVGLLTTVPILCMGIFAPLGPAIARGFGARRALAVSLTALALIGVARAIVPSVPAILATTLGIGIATGAAGALPQVLAKLHAPAAPATVGGAASAGIVAGAVLSAAVAVPLADLLGGWRVTLLALALLTLGTTAIGIGMLGRDPAEPPGPAVRRLRPRSQAWSLATVFGLQAILYWGSGAWLPGAYLERGWAEAAAAGLVAILNGAALVASLSVAGLSDRLGPRLVQIRVSAVASLAAAGGLAIAPAVAPIWTIALGLSLGAIFPLLLIYTVDLAGDAADAGSLSAFMLLIGYALAGVGPIGLGYVRDLSGGFGQTMPLLASVAALLVIVVLAPGLGPPPRARPT